MADVRLRLTRKAVLDLTEDEAAEARRCTMRGGMMAKELDHLRLMDRPYEDRYAYRLRDLTTRELVGWSLVWGSRGWATAYIYVRAKHRRYGNGTRIIGRVLKDYPNPRLGVVPHNARSYRFFQEAGVMPRL